MASACKSKVAAFDQYWLRETSAAVLHVSDTSHHAEPSPSPNSKPRLGANGQGFLTSEAERYVSGAKISCRNRLTRSVAPGSLCDSSDACTERRRAGVRSANRYARACGASFTMPASSGLKGGKLPRGGRSGCGHVAIVAVATAPWFGINEISLMSYTTLARASAALRASSVTRSPRCACSLNGETVTVMEWTAMAAQGGVRSR